jgi:hypothetical protein
MQDILLNVQEIHGIIYVSSFYCSPFLLVGCFSDYSKNPGKSKYMIKI